MSEMTSRESDANAIQSPMFQGIVRDMCSDMKLVGLIGVALGAFYCISIIGAIIGIPYIIASIRLREAADSFVGYLDANDFESLQKGFEKQKSFFFIIKILLIVGIILSVLYIIIIFGFVGIGTLMDYS